MPYIDSRSMPESARLREWWYNGLDAAVTYEIYQKLKAVPRNRGIYNFMLNQHGQALSAMTKGVLVDELWRQRVAGELQTRADALGKLLDRLAISIVDHGINPNSPAQLKTFFYEELRLPVQHKFVKGVRSVSTDREALEKLQAYPLGRPFCILILALRDCIKKLGVLKQGVDSDSRMRCSFAICGTETGRWASSKNVEGRGTNLQNVTEEMRRPFQADPDYILVYVDGEQAESRAVGFIQGTLFNDWRYMDACESGDLHTTVTKLVWDTRPWTGDPKLDRALADEVFYRWFSYRDMAKRGGHGTNYYGKPATMAKHLKVLVKLIEDFQKKYLAAFGMQTWWTDVAFKLQTQNSLTTFLGRERTFFGRPDDDSTLREAIAYEPQSVVGDIVNEGGYRLWRDIPEWQPLIQIHDAWLGQIPYTALSSLIPKILTTFQIEIRSPLSPRTLTIPAEAKVGFNWANYNTDPKHGPINLDGLKKWKGSDDRVRTEWANQNLLDRVLY